MNEQPMNIELSRVLNAPKWKVFRLLTRVWKFVDQIPTIKKVEILSKEGNVVNTGWKVLIDQFPINWIERDVINLKEGRIDFRAVEGDLTEFSGSWNINDDPNGTRVDLRVKLIVGVPCIEEFSSDFIRPLVIKNFEAILDYVEQHLISVRYADLKAGQKDKIAGFGVLGHFYNYNHMIQSFEMLNPNFKVPSREFLSGLFRVTPSFVMHEMQDFRSKTGDSVPGKFILCTFIPEMMDYEIEEVYGKVVRACRLAEKSGVGILALGGFTSIVGERLGKRINEDVDIPITTGNTYTAALAVEGVVKAAGVLDKDIKDLKAVIVGGTGDIGSACARVLVNQVKELTITGRTMVNLYMISNELKKARSAKVKISRDNQKAIRDADIVIAAANSSASILNIEWFKPGAIVCDLAYPKNLSYNSQRKDVFVFSGGLASVPTPIDPGNDIGVPSPDYCYGCFCEVIILALEKRFESYSMGRGNITPDKMAEISGMAIKHGFELAPFFWANTMISDQDIEHIKSVNHSEVDAKR